MSRSKRRTPHDALFKAVFSDAESAFALLRPVLAPELVQAIDRRSLRLEPASFVDEELREVHRDLLFSARFEEREVLLYVLVEHQRTVDLLMPLRMLRYVVRVWEAWLRKHPRTRRIPAVIPVVVHQGPGPWSGPTRLAQLFELSPALLATVERHVPALELALHDLGRTTVEALATLEAPAAARLALILLRSAGNDADLGAVLERWAALGRELVAGPGGLESLRPLVRYTLLVGKVDLEKTAERVHRTIGPEAGEVVMSTGQDLINRGLEQGYRSIVERQLRARFGELDENARTRLEGATKAQLERWADRVLVAKTLQDVLGARRKPRAGRGRG